MELSDDLRCLFSGRIERRDGAYVVEVPERELSLGDLEEGGIYRVALLDDHDAEDPDDADRTDRDSERVPRPPVEEGDHREVEIVDIGEQGDGIAKVERGYVVIVPGGEIGDEVTVEITTVMDNYAIGEIREEETEDVSDVRF